MTEQALLRLESVTVLGVWTTPFSPRIQRHKWVSVIMRPDCIVRSRKSGTCLRTLVQFEKRKNDGMDYEVTSVGRNEKSLEIPHEETPFLIQAQIVQGQISYRWCCKRSGDLEGWAGHGGTHL